MLYKTRGIVLHYIKFKETSIIVKIFTERLGLQTYIVNSVRSMKGRNKIGFFQPLNLLELVVYFKETSDINRISEVKFHDTLKTIPFHIKKSTIALFLTEILSKTLKTEEENSPLFVFLYSSIKTLDDMKEGFENFHLQFLLKLAMYLGFSPQSGQDIYGQLLLDEHMGMASLLDELMFQEYHRPIQLSNENRRVLLDDILKFYKEHIDLFGEVKSLPVLREILR